MRRSWEQESVAAKLCVCVRACVHQAETEQGEKLKSHCWKCL